MVQPVVCPARLKRDCRTPLYYSKVVEPGRSPGGREENTGKASAFTERLMIGMFEMISMNPVKFVSPSKGPTLADECASGPRVITVLPSGVPAALNAFKVMEADWFVEGLA